MYGSLNTLMSSSLGTVLNLNNEGEKEKDDYFKRIFPGSIFLLLHFISQLMSLEDPACCFIHRLYLNIRNLFDCFYN